MASTRSLQLLKSMQCSIFQTTYNPHNVRTGAKYLRRRLKGPAMMEYYPPTINISKLARHFPELELVNEYEVQRLEDVADKKKRGKGAPKKFKKGQKAKTTTGGKKKK